MDASPDYLDMPVDHTTPVLKLTSKLPARYSQDHLLLRPGVLLGLHARVLHFNLL